MSVGCRREERRAVERVALLPLENLTGDPAWNWVGPALPGIVGTELSASLKVLPLRVRDLNEAMTAFMEKRTPKFTGR